MAREHKLPLPAPSRLTISPGSRCFGTVIHSSSKGKNAMRNERPFLDFKAIKARVSIVDVLARYSVKLTRVNQTSLKGTCPLPSHASGSKGTFYASEDKSLWYCHSTSCKHNDRRAGGNVID